MNGVIKMGEYITNDKAKVDFVGFLLNEINEHAESLFDITTDEQPDTDRAEYHHVKIQGLIETLKGQIGGH